MRKSIFVGAGFVICLFANYFYSAIPCQTVLSLNNSVVLEQNIVLNGSFVLEQDIV